MVNIPLYIFLFIYFGFLFIFAFFSIVNLLHMFQTGGISFFSFVITFIVMAVVIYLLFFTWFLVKDTDWQQNLQLQFINQTTNDDYGI